jgi:acyl-CoA reductase-like NAD-dependent aldehyde dehydrogenase
MEEFVAAQIASSSEYPKLAVRFSDEWQAMTLPQRAALLKECVDRIDYNHDTSDLGINLNVEKLS